MIRFTVVTITYNAEAVLQRTLDSVLRQSYEGVEHLIIDGASTDNTLKMAGRYKLKNDTMPGGHLVIIKSEPDRGIYDAMNKGLTQASGEYIVFLNAGDFFPRDDTLESIAHECRLNELPSGELPAVLYGHTDIVDQEGNFLHHRRLKPYDGLTWRSFRYGMLVCHQAFYARTDIAKNQQYDTQYKYSADVDWCIRIMREADRMGLPLIYINNVVANYTEEGATTHHHRESLRERFRIMCRHYGYVTTILMHAWFVIRSITLIASMKITTTYLQVTKSQCG